MSEERTLDPVPFIGDLNNYLDLDKPAAFLFRVATDRYREEGICKGDFAVIRRDLEPAGDPLIAVVTGEEFLLRRRSEIEECQDEGAFTDCRFIGVITAVFRKIPLNMKTIISSK